MNSTLKTLALTMLAACMYGKTHHKPAVPLRADYSARCMGNGYDDCYEEAADKCKGTWLQSLRQKRQHHRQRNHV